MDIGHHSAISNGYGAKELGELLVIPHCKLDVTWHNPRLLVVSRCIPSKFQDLR